MDNDYGPGTDICDSKMCKGVLPVPGACIKEPTSAILVDVWDDQPRVAGLERRSAGHPNKSNAD